MTEEGLPSAELPGKGGGADFPWGAAEAVPRLLREADVVGLIGAPGGTSAAASG